MTIQQINFYRKNMQGPQDPLTLKRCLLLTFVILSVFISFIVSNAWKVERLELEAAKLETLKSDSTKKLEEYIKKYPKKSLDLGLQDVIDKKRKKKKEKEVLIQFFSKGLNTNNSGFEKYLTALSNRHADGLWLTTIELSKFGQSVSLSGATLKAETLPVYIAELGKEEAFSGTTFAMMKLGRPEKDSKHLNFTLTSEFVQ